MTLAQQIRELMGRTDAALSAAMASVDHGGTQRQIDEYRGHVAITHDRLAQVLMENRGAVLSALDAQDRHPIETAPRDGTRILVYFKRHGWLAVTWDDPHDFGIWCVDDFKHGPYPVRGYREEDATHWRPLPTPPTKEDQNDDAG